LPSDVFSFSTCKSTAIDGKHQENTLKSFDYSSTALGNFFILLNFASKIQNVLICRTNIRWSLPMKTILLFSASCCVLSAHGQSELADTLLHTATVYAHTARAMAPNQQLSGERLEALNAHSVADALRYFSGVQLKDYGGVGGLKTLDIRSMGSQHMGIFYDGLQLGNAQNGQIDLGRFSLDNIEQIDLYNGQKSDLLQSAHDFGTSGTVYLRTRRPTGNLLRGTFRTGSFGLINPSILWEHRWNERISTSVSSEYTSSTGKYDFRYRKYFPDHSLAYDTTATRQNGDIESLRLEATVFGKTRWETPGEWHAKIYGYLSERGIPGAIVNNVWYSGQRQWDRSVFAQGNWKQRISERYSFLVNGKVAHDYLRYQNPDSTQLYIDNTFRQEELYISAAHAFRLLPDMSLNDMDWSASIATDYQWNSLNANLNNFAEPQRNTLLVSAASRFSWQRWKLMVSLLGTHAFDHTKNGNSSHICYTPAFFINYAPAPGLSLRTFFKRSMRLPTFNDLYYTEVGNSSLRPEYTTQYNLGALYIKDFEGWFSHLELKADGYLNKVTDKIIAVPKGSGQYRWMMMNIGKVLAYGTDVTAQAEIKPSTQWSLVGCLNYAFQRAEDRTDPDDNDPKFGTYKGQIAYIPQHSGSATATLRYRFISLNYSFIYVGERYRASSNILANYEQPWYTHDLSLGFDGTHTLLHSKLLFEVNNLFDQQYEVVPNYPMPGRNYRVCLKFSW